MKKFLIYVGTWLLLTSCGEEELIISDFLEFERVAILDAWNIHNAAGFLAAEDQGSLYIASREPNPETTLLGERLLRFDVKEETVTPDYLDIIDFVTKEIHIIEDDIIIVAGQHVNTYDLNFESEPTSVPHGLLLSRFGSTLYEGDIYIWGGDLNDVDSDKLKRWNTENNSFETIATLPARKAGAHGEVVDDKLYIFGGQEHWVEEPPNDLIIIYDFKNEAFETANLPFPVYRTFTDVYKEKIFIAGQIIDNDPFTEDLDIFFALFDPDDNTIKELETSLSDVDFRTIHQMAIYENDIYVLYGDVGEDPGEINLMKHTIRTFP